MTKKQKTLCGLLLTSMFFTAGTAFASSDDSLVKTPNTDFNDIGNALVSTGYSQTVLPNGDVLVGVTGDSVASYDSSSGNWVCYGDAW